VTFLHTKHFYAPVLALFNSIRQNDKFAVHKLKRTTCLYPTGTDRNNMVETENSLDNYPLPWEMSKLFQGATAVWTSLELKNPKPEDIAVSLASAGIVYALNSTLNVHCIEGKCKFSDFSVQSCMSVQSSPQMPGPKISNNNYDPYYTYMSRDLRFI